MRIVASIYADRGLNSEFNTFKSNIFPTRFDRYLVLRNTTQAEHEKIGTLLIMEQLAAGPIPTSITAPVISVTKGRPVGAKNKSTTTPSFSI